MCVEHSIVKAMNDVWNKKGCIWRTCFAYTYNGNGMGSIHVVTIVWCATLLNLLHWLLSYAYVLWGRNIFILYNLVEGL